MQAFRSLDRFDPARPLRPWLMRITMNQARNRHRSVARYLAAIDRWVRLEGGWRTASDSRQEPKPSLDDVRLLRMAVSALPDRDREVVCLRFFLGLGEAETAAALEVPVGTAKSRLSRALARLRTVVERDFPGLREALEG